MFSGQRSLNRNLCYELLTAAYSMTDGFGMEEGAEVIYDCKSTMYTSKPVRLPAVGDLSLFSATLIFCDSRVEKLAFRPPM